MKFGSNLQRNQVPEWSSKYINYKGLKKLIKAAVAAQKQNGRSADLTEILFSLDRNLEVVDEFYNKKYSESSRRFKLLRERYQRNVENRGGSTLEEVEDIMAALLELRSQLRKLQWYGEVNRRGFVKITKKLDKRIPSANTQPTYIALKVDPKPFASNKATTIDMGALNEWLSQLGEVKANELDGSNASSGGLSRSTTRSYFKVSNEVMDDVNKAVRNDDVTSMNQHLQTAIKEQSGEEEAVNRLLLNALQHAISCHSRKSALSLLSQLNTLEDPDDMHQRNCIHRLVLTISRTRSFQGDGTASSQAQREAGNSIVPAEAPNTQGTLYAAEETEPTIALTADDPSVKILILLLENLQPSQRNALVSRDSRGRLPIHYGAQYGFVVLCQIIVNHMQRWKQLDTSQGLSAPEWHDNEENTPLHLAVMGGHPLLTRYLLDFIKSSLEASGQARDGPFLADSSSLLSMAVKANFVKIVRLLVETGADVNRRDEGGESALHAASRLGHVASAKALLEGSKWCTSDPDIIEPTFEWTPLIFASVEGHLEVAELLVKAQAQMNRKDISGWTAKEHAALRGHMDIAKILGVCEPLPNGESAEVKAAASLAHRKAAGEVKNSIEQGKDNGAPKSPPTVKTFGHRYLKGESMILVSLGSIDHRKAVKPVELENIPIDQAHSTQLDTALSVIVSAEGAAGEPEVIDLPVQENISTEPIAFTAKDPSKARIRFDITPTYAGSKEHVIGRGVAVLSNIKQTLGSKRMNLQGDMSVPIIAAKTLEYIGSVHFNFTVITPFSHPNMSVSENKTYWKSLSEPMLIGHRGLGKNINDRKTLQLGENTIQSFIAAANLGASYVEFDVQLTKDHVPVIYHDFLVSETGIDAPVHTLTLEQFMHVNQERTPRGSRPPSPKNPTTSPAQGPVRTPNMRPTRANSLSLMPDRDIGPDMDDRMKHTRDFKQKGFKGNSRGNFIQAPFTTLEEMLRKLPEDIGFNIEMKYPMLWESEEQEMDTYAVELNHFVETVLNKIYDLGGKRNFLFSSFNPDICLLLSFKQPSIPIMFLTDAGGAPTGDIRASSLQEAIRFASRWNLLGIVSASEPFVACPRLVRVVKESGLVCVSYGTQNNDPNNVQLQVNEGIDAVIVDSVLAIRKGLTGSASQTAAIAQKEVQAALAVESVRGSPLSVR